MHRPTVQQLCEAAHDARARTLALVEDLSDVQLVGPKLGTVNPLLWELGHIAWFQERWMARRAGEASVRADADGLYDSIQVPHALRWDLPLPDRAQTLAYLEHTLGVATERAQAGGATDEDRYHLRYTTHHEDMHGEAFAWARQTHGYPEPPGADVPVDGDGALAGDVGIPAGDYAIGASPTDGFAFDNERWRHVVSLPAFRIARAPVTAGEFAAFVDAGGYRDERLWSPEGRAFVAATEACAPVYWRRGPNGWQRRHFDQWVDLRPHRPVVHVAYYEAEAYCRWAGRKLPTEAQWEVAASFDGGADAAIGAGRRRRYPWGGEDPSSAHANLDGRHPAGRDVADLAPGDSAIGCRQMLGNVWEWTADWFAPYPGFTPDPYLQYSQPWFHSHRTLRGGSMHTRGRLLRNTLRNFAVPTRRDLFAGFRTCAR